MFVPCCCDHAVPWIARRFLSVACSALMYGSEPNANQRLCSCTCVDATGRKIKVQCSRRSDGDEMTRVIWTMIDNLLSRSLVPVEYYDLGLPHRDKTKDQVTIDAANAIRSTTSASCATTSPPMARAGCVNVLHEKIC